MRGQLRMLSEAGFDVTLIASPGEELAAAAAREGVATIAIPMSREISPIRDLVALLALYPQLEN